MKELEIIRAIEKTVSFYSGWTIGMTDDPERRRDEHGNPEHWHQWRANIETIARKVEKYFLDKGMKGAPSGEEHPNYVYIFWAK